MGFANFAISLRLLNVIIFGYKYSCCIQKRLKPETLKRNHLEHGGEAETEECGRDVGLAESGYHLSRRRR
jgi:hypothetical protein